MEALFFLIPIFWVGFVIARRATSIKRAEVLMGVALPVGVAIYIFILNLLSFVIKGNPGIFISYFVFILIGLVISRKIKADKIDFPKKTVLFLFILSVAIWGIFLFWKVGHTILGGDTSLYYSIAKTFARGNFPIVSPWQPDLPVKYHYGASIFLGASESFTGYSFEFLHRFIVFLLLLSVSQILIWAWRRHESLLSLLIYQLVPIVALISVGTFMFVGPHFPLKLPELGSIRDLVLWGRELPSIHLSFETYGAPVNLSIIIYFLFYTVSLSVFYSLMVFLIFPRFKNKVFRWLIVGVILSSLALINESLFLPALIVSTLLLLWKEKTILKLFITGLFFGFIVLFQGGIITDSLIRKDNLNASVLFFPKKEDLPYEFVGYHRAQQASKPFDIEEKWLPFVWYHPGFGWLYVFSLSGFLYLLIKKEKEKLLILTAFLISAVTSIIAYNVIVPKYLAANGNRLMLFSYQIFGVLVTLLLIWIFESVQKKKVVAIIFSLFAVWLLIPSLGPPILQLSEARLAQNRLLSVNEDLPETLKWIENNVSIEKRVVDITTNAPFSGRPEEVLVKAGAFIPTFASKYRAYTLEASPEYLDLVFTLNPDVVKELRVSYVIIDSNYFQTLPEVRKNDIQNAVFFEKVFETSSPYAQWERIYRIKDEYLKEGSILSGTFKELLGFIPQDTALYIEDWRSENPWATLRKAVIFAFKDWNPYATPGSGVYLNVEAFVSIREPAKAQKFDYLVLSKDTNPNSICECKLERIWQGIGDNVKVWRVLKWQNKKIQF